MKRLILTLLVLSSLAWGKRAPLFKRSPSFKSWVLFQSFEVNHYTVFRNSIFRNYRVENVFTNAQDDPTAIQEEYQVLTTYNYISKVSYGYFYGSLTFNYVRGEDQFFDANILRSELSRSYEQFSLIPEIFFRISVFSVGFGYYFNFDQTPFISTALYNKNSPIIKAGIDLPAARWLSFLTHFYMSPRGFRFDDNTIYSVSFGIRLNFTYYVSFLFLYNRTILASDNMEDNIFRYSFDFRFTPSFSISTGYAQLVYTENRNPYNQISVAMNYLHEFRKKR